MESWIKEFWDLAPETDGSRAGPRSPYELREHEAWEAVFKRRKVSRHLYLTARALTNPQLAGRELITSSRRLINQSRLQIYKSNRLLVIRPRRKPN